MPWSIALLLGTVLSFGWSFAYNHQWLALDSERTRLADLDHSLQQAAEAALQAGASGHAKRESQARLDQLLKDAPTLVEIKDFRWIMEKIRRLTTTHSLALVDISRTPEIGPVLLSSLSAATYSVRLQGSRPAFVSFAREVETQLRGVEITNIRFSPLISSEKKPATTNQFFIEFKMVFLIKPE